MEEKKNEENLKQSNVDIMKLFEEKKDFLKIQAPMVRYSKLPFRLLCREYGTDICYTPMILSDSFNNSKKARYEEFTTCEFDTPLVVQFAANNALDFSLAAQKVEKYSSAVNLNCGCPQKWAIKEEIGAIMIEKPNLIYDIVKTTRNLTSDNFPVSVKIRIFDDIKKTIDLAKIIEKSGAKWIDVHGRTIKERSNPVNYEAIKLNVKIPVVHNGDVYSLKDAQKFHELTNCDGCMSAQGILKNPMLFSGINQVTNECIQKFIDYSIKYGTSYGVIHHHCSFMLDSIISKDLFIELNEITSICGLIDFLKENKIYK